jgi:hypothetical protein
MRYDWNRTPESARYWVPGDEVWVDNTLYEVIDSPKENEVRLRRCEPIKLRALPTLEYE